MNTMETLRLRLETTLKDAMRTKDDVRRRTIRMVLAAVKLSEIERGSALDDTTILAIIQKEVKNRRESIQEAQKANRADLVSANEAEIRVLEGYLPKPISQDELTTLAKAAISEVGAKSPAEMGKVMKILLPRVQGKVSGDQVSQVVRQLLLQAN
jgi:uncharacterized protein YqeY